MLQPGLPAGRLGALSVAGASGFVCLWSARALTGWVPRAFFPAPWDIIGRLVELTREPFAGHTLPVHLLSSLQRFAMGFVFALLTGIAVGLLMARFRWVDEIIGPVFEAVRFVAPIAWAPFAALWFGPGIAGPGLIIFMGALPPDFFKNHPGAQLFH